MPLSLTDDPLALLEDAIREAERRLCGQTDDIALLKRAGLPHTDALQVLQEIEATLRQARDHHMLVTALMEAMPSASPT